MPAKYEFSIKIIHNDHSQHQKINLEVFNLSVNALSTEEAIKLAKEKAEEIKDTLYEKPKNNSTIDVALSLLRVEIV